MKLEGIGEQVGVGDGLEGVVLAARFDHLVVGEGVLIWYFSMFL